jgi:hypothetical protein
MFCCFRNSTVSNGYDARRLAVSRPVVGCVRLTCQSGASDPIGDRYVRREFEPVPKTGLPSLFSNALGNCVVVLPERRSASSLNSQRSGRETGPYVQ